MEIKYPDYNNSILNLACSILKYYGLEAPHPTLPYVDSLLQRKYKNIIVMVLDGMGLDILEDNLPDGSFLKENLKIELSSVFPPTTTAATTTLSSGLSPMEHGWLGWSLYFNEINENINIFINTNGDGQEVTDYHVANRYISYRSIPDRINAEGKYKAYTISPFGTTKVDTLEAFCEAIKTTCKNNASNYIYAYWPEPDSTMHIMGCSSKEAKISLEEINKQIEGLASELQDTLLMITADHGHMDTHSKLILDYPDLIATLQQLPSIEPRALSFFIKEGIKDKFVSLFNHYFKETFLLFSKEEVIENKIFGEGIEHTKFKDFIGDYLAIAISDISLFNTKEEHEKFIGVHAGLTAKEMVVPLIVITT